MSLKIGILNFQHSNHNYGAVLQAAALEHILRGEGYFVEHIDYNAKVNFSFKAVLKKVLQSFNILPESVNVPPANSETFENFRKLNIKRTKVISSKDEFSNSVKKYDLVIVGSDQVWRSKMSKTPDVYFLKYVPKSVARISYAASFGVKDWEPDREDFISKVASQELLKFHAISCRESSGVKICNNRFGVKAEHVLDPLLLVDESFVNKVIESSSLSEDRLIYYKLDKSDEFKKIINSIESFYSCNARDIYRKENDKKAYEDVSQWMRSIYDSEIVVSDSFHCICLALRFEKEVIYIRNPDRGEARLLDLFQVLNIKQKKLENLGDNVFILEKGKSFEKEMNRMKEVSKSFLSKEINSILLNLE